MPLTDISGKKTSIRKEKDIREHTLLGYKEIFADVVNVLLFQGKERIKPEDLIDKEGRSQYKFADAAREQERDVIKQWKEAEIQIAMIGLENQTKPDEWMPVRIIGYDGASYRNQLPVQEGKRVLPVITLVLYFGYKQPWNTARSLLEKVHMPEELRPYFNDYKINVFEIAWLSDEMIDSFHSDFWIIADFLRQMRKTGDYRPKRSDASFTRVAEVMQLLAAIRNDDRYLEPDLLEYYKKRGGAQMCELIDKWLAEGEAKGKTEGRMEAIYSIMQNLQLPLEEAMNALSIPEQEKPRYREMIGTVRS